MTVFRGYALLLLVFFVSGCGDDHDKKQEGKNSSPTYMLYSPNGEPLNGGQLGRPTCEQAETQWFEHMSAGHDRIDEDSFIKDAGVQFARMDIDHNGYIVSEELDRFREPYRQQPPAPKPEKKDSDDGQSGHGHKGKGKSSSGGGSQSDQSFTTSDPVMSADANLDFKVTPDEFYKQAKDVFANLDTNHDGFLDRAEVLAMCEKKKS